MDATFTEIYLKVIRSIGSKSSSAMRIEIKKLLPFTIAMVGQFLDFGNIS
jgi:hypothetical protein